MKSPKPNLVTMWNEGQFGDKEFVVSCRGRPFSILTAPQFPTPDVTYVDFNLIHELNIKMSDLQCRKLSYGGQRLRILGKISTSVQCIVDGASAGNLQFKAHVVEDLKKHFDTHSIAGVKLSGKLLGQPSKPTTDYSTEPTDEDASDQSESDAAAFARKPKKKKKKLPIKANDVSSSESASVPDPDEYVDEYANISTIRTNDVTSTQPGRVFPQPASPRSVALLMRQRCLRAGMNDAEMRKALLCSGVDISTVAETVTAMTEEVSTFTGVTNSAMVAHPPPFLTIMEAREALTANAMTAGYNDDQAEVTHGPDKCTMFCEDRPPDQLPDDCGYHPSYVTEDFVPCGLQCPGGWCPCYERWGEGGGR